MEKLSQREGTMFQFLLGNRSEFASRLDAGAVWYRRNNQQKAALPWPHEFPAVLCLEFHSGDCMLQMGQEAGQNLGLPAFHQSMWHGCLIHKVLGMPWIALEMGISAF